MARPSRYSAEVKDRRTREARRQQEANPLGATAATGLERFFSRPDARVIESTASTMRMFRRGEALLLMPNVVVR